MGRQSNELLVAQKLESLSETKNHLDSSSRVGRILVQVIDVFIRRLSSMVIPEEDISNVDTLERYDPKDPFKQVDRGLQKDYISLRSLRVSVVYPFRSQHSLPESH